MTEDPKISQRYRELGREEPPHEIDAAILAAAHRTAEARPAPLVVPSGRLRWYFPLAAAAIIVLAVAVTVQVERQQPDPELAVPPVTSPRAPAEEQAEPAKPAAKAEVFVPDPQRSRELRAQRDAAPVEQKAAPATAPVPAPASPPAAAEREERARIQDSPAPAPGQEQESRANAERRALDELRMQRRLETPPQAQSTPAAEAPAPQAKPAPRAEPSAELARADAAGRASSMMAKSAARSPEQWLQGIADLRRQGRHEEADKALAEFRKRYPDYRISEAMLEKVEKK